jgi:hypothetical protein
MNGNTVDQGADNKLGAGIHWLRRSAAVSFCLLLVLTLGVVFTRVIGARIPEQRATLEKLITDRTGLVVRFDNVHFAWDLDGMNAVFTRVELTDPKAGRVRVVAPELRVEFDTWDFLRHQQFSLGHVTLSSPDIEITGDPDEPNSVAAERRGAKRRQASNARPDERGPDERTMLRQYLRWAELMPIGRIEVEGARVHLLRRGERAPRHSFTLSQAVVSRGNSTFAAHGTLLLSQDVGQSLFVSAKLEGLDVGGNISGDLRLIARRVFLQELPFAGLEGRGTVDARFALRNGRVDSGSWQASARELELPGEDHRGFDHVSVSGKLSRDQDDVLLELSDLQLSRGARLERAPVLSARFALRPGTVEIVRTTAQAERLPFMAAELMAGILEPQLVRLPAEALAGWTPTAGELRTLAYDSGVRTKADPAWSFSAQVSGLDLTRIDDVRLSQLSGHVRLAPGTLTLRFDPASAASFRTAQAAEPRPLTLGGEVVVQAGGEVPSLRFENFSATSNDAGARVDGSWNPAAARPGSLNLRVTAMDRALLQDAWLLVAADQPLPEVFADVEQGRILDAKIDLAPAADGGANWDRSSGTLAFAELVTGGKDMPRLSAGKGSVKFANGGSRLDLDGGQLEDLTIRTARLDRPRSGAPRLRATLAGSLDSAVLRDLLDSQGLDRLRGSVELDAEARGERELRDPATWRVAARVKDATVPLGDGLPAIDSLAGTIRYASGQLRGATLAGNWLGGPVEIESRRAAARAVSLAVSGEAEAAPLLKLLGQEEAAQRVGGRLAWSGSAQRAADSDQWRLSLASELTGVESRLPQPFDKSRTRAVPIEANLLVSRDGIREFQVNGSQVDIRGQVQAGVTSASFEVDGISGELRRPGGARAAAEVRIAQLEYARAPQVLAVAGALLPVDGELTLTIDDSRHAGRSLGALHASVNRRADGSSFALDSPAASIHQVSASGQCAAEHCHAEFSADTTHLVALLPTMPLPAEWPVASLHAAGTMDWPIETSGDFARSLAGSFEIQTEGASREHQLTARAALANGQIELTNVQGTGPEPDQVFRGNGRIGLLARDYDLTVDYERVSLAAAAVPSTARAPLTRAWSALRGSVARRGWTAAPETKRVQWHGTWDSDN